MRRLSVVVYLLGSLGSAYGQDTATIVGTVSDQSGASVPEAQLMLVNNGTQFTRVVNTNESGLYVASQIPTGE
jgi:Carboxypeptidase regulatory-like domain